VELDEMCFQIRATLPWWWNRTRRAFGNKVVIAIDSQASNAAEELQKLGGAQAILATAPDSKAMSSLIDGLAPTGKFVVVGISSDPIAVSPLQLIV